MLSVLSVKYLGERFSRSNSRSNTGGQAIGPFRTGTALVSKLPHVFSCQYCVVHSVISGKLISALTISLELNIVSSRDWKYNSDN